jgi:hypothetical protein
MTQQIEVEKAVILFAKSLSKGIPIGFCEERLNLQSENVHKDLPQG